MMGIRNTEGWGLVPQGPRRGPSNKQIAAAAKKVAKKAIKLAFGKKSS
jgi:hypothetical protein